MSALRILSAKIFSLLYQDQSARQSVSAWAGFELHGFPKPVSCLEHILKVIAGWYEHLVGA